jgi:hypothetical protein
MGGYCTNACESPILEPAYEMQRMDMHIMKIGQPWINEF